MSSVHHDFCSNARCQKSRVKHFKACSTCRDWFTLLLNMQAIGCEVLGAYHGDAQPSYVSTGYQVSSIRMQIMHACVQLRHAALHDGA